MLNFAKKGPTGEAGTSGQSVLINEYTANFTLALHADCKKVVLEGNGFGGTGGGGSRREGNAACGGGSGGQGAGRSKEEYDVSDLASTTLVGTFGSAPSVGIGRQVADGEGNGGDGEDGGDLTITDGTNTLLWAEGGAKGLGGRLNASVEGGTGKGRGTWVGADGAPGRYAGNEAGPAPNMQGCGGGSGGGAGNNTNSTLQTSANSYRGTAAAAGIVAIRGAALGATGTNAPTQLAPQGGGGGVGGGGQNAASTDAGDGGDGFRGGGSGGGGGVARATDAAAAGDSGQAGAAWARVTQFFGP